MLFNKNHITGEIHNYIKHKLISECDNISFPANSDILSLYKYLVDSPDKFYSRHSFDKFYNLLLMNKESLKDILKDIESDLDISIRNLIDVNKMNFHEDVLPSDNIKLITIIDKEIHYNYLKVLETTFYFFLLIPAKLSRLKRNKRVDGLDLYNVVEELKLGQFSFIEAHYNNTVRNGIAHGKVKYTDKDIIYEDKKGNIEQITCKEIIKKFDKLIDCVNGLCFAYTLFCFTNPDYLNNNYIKIPRSLLIQELQAKSNVPGWDVIDCLDSVALNSKEQLMIYVKNDNWDFHKVLYYSFYTAYWAERLTKAYDRIFFHLDSKHSIDGWAAFDANELRRLINLESSKIEDYGNILENNLVYFDPKIRFPRFIYQLGSLKANIVINMPFQWRSAMDQFSRKQFRIRDTQIHSINGSLVIRDPCIVIKKDCLNNVIEIIRENYRFIINSVIKYSRKKFSLFSFTRYQSVQYIRVCIFDKDDRVRNLRNSGLTKNLIATIELNTSKTIKTIDIFNGKLELKGKYRIVWNKNWCGYSDAFESDNLS